jgi:uncharacterized protein (TIGR03435 family)
MKLRHAFVVALACLGIAHAQIPKFEVASVKPSAPFIPASGSRQVVRGGPESSDPALARFDNVNLFSLVMMAYGIQSFQLSGPDWLNSARFGINARVPQGATRDQYRMMLQDLLAERFKLALHHQTKEATGYELVVAKNGPKLKESPVDPDAPDPGLQPPPSALSPPPGYTGAVSMNITRQTAEQLAARLAAALGLPVTDATGLKGRYDVTLFWGLSATETSIDTAGPSLPTLLQAVQEQLGLKLVPKKGQIDILVIDHIEKEPTEN